MPQTITDVSTFSSSVTPPAGGDLRNSASVLTPFQQLANRTRYLYDGLVQSLLPSNTATERYRYASRSMEVQVATLPAWNTASDWAFGTLYSEKTVTCQVTYQTFLHYPIDPPDGATLTNLGMSVRGASGHSAFPGGAPATPPFVQLCRYDSTTRSTSIVFTAPVVWAIVGTAAAWQAGVLWNSALTTGEVIDRTRYSYFLVVGSEGGAGAIAGMIVYGVSYTCSITRQDPGGS